jgi:hypothetical protein
VQSKSDHSRWHKLSPPSTVVVVRWALPINVAPMAKVENGCGLLRVIDFIHHLIVADAHPQFFSLFPERLNVA